VFVILCITTSRAYSLHQNSDQVPNPSISIPVKAQDPQRAITTQLLQNLQTSYHSPNIHRRTTPHTSLHHPKETRKSSSRSFSRIPSSRIPMPMLLSLPQLCEAWSNRSTGRPFVGSETKEIRGLSLNRCDPRGGGQGRVFGEVFGIRVRFRERVRCLRQERMARILGRPGGGGSLQSLGCGRVRNVEVDM
jgi:hypothetical protein